MRAQLYTLLAVTRHASAPVEPQTTRH
jgi:hypothetical protein